MADISKITLPSGTTYDIKDATARAQIAEIAGLTTIVFVGVSTTAITDGGNEKPTVGGEQKNPSAGQLYFYGTNEFIWGKDNKWHELGSLSSLGQLAYKDSVSATYTPSGSVSTPTISLKTAGNTATIKNPTAVNVVNEISAVAPGDTAPSNAFTYYSVANETLSLYQLGFTKVDSITTDNVTVKSGDAEYQASQPSFSGTIATIESN